MAGVAWGFPGQGVTWASVVERLDGAPVHELVVRLRDRIGDDPWAEVDPTDTRRAQAAILTASLLALDDLDGPPVAVCGHSFGELAALVAAGVITAEDGLELALLRGELGAEVQAATNGAMLAVVGVDEWTVERLRRLAVAAVPGPCDLAVRNHAVQVVLAGAPATLDHVEAEAEALGGRAHRLPIGGAFHTPAMAPVVARYEAAVAQRELAPPTVPVVLSTSPGAVTDGSDLAALPARLGDALVMPVDWPRAIAEVKALGATEGLDVGPGNALGKVGRRAGLRFTSLWDPLVEP